MPRLSEAKKDVISCEKLRLGANNLSAGDIRMGQPIQKEFWISITKRLWRRTRGTETSKYPEEKKTKVIPQVVASERGVAQTVVVTAATGL
jgi:hypothetical protein